MATKVRLTPVLAFWLAYCLMKSSREAWPHKKAARLWSASSSTIHGGGPERRSAGTAGLVPLGRGLQGRVGLAIRVEHLEEGAGVAGREGADGGPLDGFLRGLDERGDGETGDGLALGRGGALYERLVLWRDAEVEAVGGEGGHGVAPVESSMLYGKMPHEVQPDHRLPHYRAVSRVGRGNHAPQAVVRDASGGQQTGSPVIDTRGDHRFFLTNEGSSLQSSRGMVSHNSPCPARGTSVYLFSWFTTQANVPTSPL